jgi:hypothetical protein
MSRILHVLTFLVFACALVAVCCSHDMVTSPAGAKPQIAQVQPNPTHSNSVLIIAGTHFDQHATFDLRQGAVVKTTLTNPILAATDSMVGTQVNATIPPGTPLGKYQACATTSAGTGCGPVLIEIF